LGGVGLIGPAAGVLEKGLVLVLAGLAKTNLVAGRCYHRRHSAFRTIKGGICWQLDSWFADFAQVLLLGYQRMLSTTF